MKHLGILTLLSIGLIACTSPESTPNDAKVTPPQQANSQNSDRPERPAKDGERRGPSEAALTVCADKTANDTCSFESDRGTIAGTCKAGPRDEAQLACVPEGRRPGGPEGGKRPE